MAAKKDKSGIDALRMDMQTLADAFWKFRDTMLTEAAVQEAEQQIASIGDADAAWVVPDDASVGRAAEFMNALAQPQRLRMALILAEGSTNVASIVSDLGMKTTGAAYHHLNVLVNSGIVVQPERGIFALSPDAAAQVNALLIALFGSADQGDKPNSKKKKKK